MASYKKRGTGWSVRWRDPDGTSRRRQVPTRATRDELIRSVAEANALGRPWEPSRPAPEILGCLGAYLQDRRRIWRASSLTAISSGLGIFGAWLEARTRRTRAGLDVLDRSLLSAFWDYYRSERGASVATANGRVRDVEAFWAWCYDHDDYGDHTPRPRRLELPAAVRTTTTAPTWAQMDAAIGVSRERYRRLLWILRCTGLRKRQAQRLCWEDFDLEAGTLRIRPELGKTQRERSGRVVPVAPVLLAEIAGWGVREGPLFGSWDANSRVMRGVWERSGAPAEVWEQRTVHAFRKGFVSGLIGLGASREAVEFLVGHSMGLRGVYTDPAALGLQETVALVPDLGACVRGVSRPLKLRAKMESGSGS